MLELPYVVLSSLAWVSQHQNLTMNFQTMSRKTTSLPAARKSSVSKSASVWRPAESVLVKVIGIAVYRGRLLAAEILDDKGRLKGVRPLGGRIERGESREDALHREFEEELGCAISLHGAWRVYENIYMHHGKVGHEYLFARNIQLLDTKLYEQEHIVFSEDSGMEVSAHWYDLKQLEQGSPELFPPALRQDLIL